MGWFTTPIELTANVVYDRSRSTASTIYQQANSKLWHTDESPDAGQQQEQLDHETREAALSTEEREVFEELSQEQMGRWMADLPHYDRNELLGNDEFMREYWPKTRHGIEESEELQEQFKLNETEHRTSGPNGPVCTEHPSNGTIDTVTYTPEVTETMGRTAKRDEKGMAELSPGGQGSVRGETTESESAKAERTEKRQGTVEICAKDPDGCPTSLNAFFHEGNRRHAGLRWKTNSSPKRFEADPREYLETETDENERISSTFEESTTKATPSEGTSTDPSAESNPSQNADTEAIDSNEDRLMNYDEGTEEHTNPTTEATENATEETTAQPDRSAPANQSETEDAQETDASHTEDSDDGLMEYDDGSIEHERRETDNDATGTANDESTDKDLDESGLSL